MLNVTARTGSNSAAPTDCSKTEGRPRRVVFRSGVLPTAAAVLPAPSSDAPVPPVRFDATSVQPPTSDTGPHATQPRTRSSRSTRTAGGSRDARSFGRTAPSDATSEDEADLRQLDLFSPATRSSSLPSVRVPASVGALASIGGTDSSTTEATSSVRSTRAVGAALADPFDLEDIGWERGLICVVTLLAVLTAIWWAF